MVVMGMSPCRYMIPQNIQQPPPPVRTAEYPPPVVKQDYHPVVRKAKPRQVRYEEDDPSDDDDDEEEEYDEPPRRKAPQRKTVAPQATPSAPVEEEDEEDKPKDPTSRLKKMVKRSKDFKSIRKRLSSRGEVYRPNRKQGQGQPSELPTQEGGAFPALLIPALTALAPFAGEVAKDVYNAIKRKIKGEGNVRQKMGRRLKTKQERLEFVVEVLKKLKL